CFTADSHLINCAHLVAIPTASLDTTTNCTSPPCFNCYACEARGDSGRAPLSAIDVTSVFDLFAFLPILAPMSRTELWIVSAGLLLSPERAPIGGSIQLSYRARERRS